MKAIAWKSRPFYDKLFIICGGIALPLFGLLGLAVVWLVFIAANKWLKFARWEGENQES